MTVRMLDEVLAIGDRGIILLTENTGFPLSAGSQLKDARGRLHTVSSVTPQESWLMLFIESSDPAYFERLFRDVRLDATVFEVYEGESIKE